MTLAQVALGSAGHDLRIFECSKCDHSHQIVIAADPLQSDALRWLSSELKPPN
jgi:hypothetical protein